VTAASKAALVGVLVVGTDQLSKHLLKDSLHLGAERKLLPGLALVNTRNRGVAFGVQPGSSLVVSAVVGVALLALLVYFVRHSERTLIWLPTGLLLGGAVGNVIDRVRQGAVTDFIKLPLGWPPFNLADACITAGVLILVVLLWQQDSSPQASTPSQAKTSPETP
jgi:signal peptidase II